MINEAAKLQRKAIRIITFDNQFASTEPLFKELKILLFHKMIQVQNYHLVLSHLNNMQMMQMININTTQGKYTIIKLPYHMLKLLATDYNL